MGETKFWKPKGGIPFVSRNDKSESLSSSVQKSKGLAKLFKGLGVFGVVLVLLVVVVGVVAFYFVIKPGYALLEFQGKLLSDKTAIENAFKNQDVEGINNSLTSMKSHIEEFKQVRDANFSWAKNFSYTKAYYDDSEHFANAGVLGVEAILEFVKVVEPFQEATGFKKKDDVVVNDPNAPSGLAEAVAQWVSIMPEVADKMDPVIEKFDLVGTELESVDANRYPENFNGVPIKSNIVAAQQYLTQASEYGPDIKAALVIVPSLLGVGTPEKRYAIIMQNNVEIRPTGGFWTNFATFKIKDAKLNSDFTSKDMYSLDEIISTTDTPWTSPWKPPYSPYKQFLKSEHTYARDANFSPDYITAVDEWMWYYRKVGTIVPSEAKPINGVFALDTRVIEKLLEVTGPVTVNGMTFSKDNVVLELEKMASLTLKEQQGRKKVLGDLMEEMLINMYKSESNLWPKFIEAALTLATEKHILAYVFDNPKGQELLEKYNFSGRIMPYDKGDYVYIVSSNLGGGKTNLFISKDVTHEVKQEGDKWVREVTINYTYNPAPSGWEPLVEPYRDWVRLYVPAGSTLIGIEGSEASTDLDKGEERGRQYFAGYLVVNPDSKKAIKFKYEIPKSLVTDKAYNLYLQKQPGTFNDKHSVTVKGKSQSVELITDKELKFTF